MSEWISVKERYPALGDKVLVWFGDEAEPYMDVWKYDGQNIFFSPKQLKRHDPHCAGPHQCVTHWQPLPDPPSVPHD